MKSTNKSNMVVILCTLAAAYGRGALSGPASSNRLLGGGKVEPGKYPFMAEVRARDSRGEWQHTCGGTIIDNRHVLTAASCVVIGGQVVRPKERQIRLGCNKLSECESIGATHNVSAIMAHYKYLQRFNKIANDIAVLKLGSEIKFNTNDSSRGAIGQVGLASTVHHCCERQEKLTAVGWGDTDTNGKQTNSLREASLDTSPLDKCKSTWGLDFQTNTICAGNFSRNICRGDSGGPFITKLRQRGQIQVGIISVGSKRCGAKPSTGTKVASFRKWISECISDKGCKTLES